MAISDLTAERLRELLHYNPVTGDFSWLVGRPKASRGAVAGCLPPSGYRTIRIDGQIYLAHRLAWLYMTGTWPENLIDHKDRNQSDNRWDNLREATHSQNHQNQHARRDSSSGIKGVYRHKQTSGSWVASLKINGRHLRGCFPSMEEAIATRSAWEKEHFTHSPVTDRP
jgi:hypothetical protein